MDICSKIISCYPIFQRIFSLGKSYAIFYKYFNTKMSPLDFIFVKNQKAKKINQKALYLKIECVFILVI